jgi:hypothetical protein
MHHTMVRAERYRKWKQGQVVEDAEAIVEEAVVDSVCGGRGGLGS